jgi:hypothetical protein
LWIMRIEGILAALKHAFGYGEPIASRDSLKEFLDTRAAFLAQKCVVEFCRVRSGIQWVKLFQEEAFLSALERSRWISFGATLGQVTEMVHGVLREPDTWADVKLRILLCSLAQEIVDEHAIRSSPPADFTCSATALIKRHLEHAETSPSRPVRSIPETTSEIVFDSLPLAKNVRQHDADYILNNLRMNLVAAHEEFRRRARLAEIRESLSPSEASPEKTAPSPVKRQDLWDR